MIGAQILGIGSQDGSVNLQSIVPQGNDCVDNVSLSKLGPYGTTEITYTWIDYGSEGGAYWTEDGDSKATGVTFIPGEALWIQASGSDQFVQSKGQVSTSDISVRLREGATMVSNPTPITIDIQKILPTGPDCVDNLSMSKVGPYGTTETTYTWIDYGSEGGAYWTEDGDSKASGSGVKIEPGAGLWLQASSTEQYIVFPGVEL